MLYAYDTSSVVGPGAELERRLSDTTRPDHRRMPGVGRLSRSRSAGTMTGSEQVLIKDWCQQYPSHSVGTLLFGRDGYLYASAGDGASFNNVDYGQYGATTPAIRPTRVAIRQVRLVLR